MKLLNLRVRLMRISYIAEKFLFRKILFFLLGFFIFEINALLFELVWQLRGAAILISSINFIMGISIVSFDAFLTFKQLIYQFLGDILAGLIGILINFYLIFG